jgi:magnesium-protoporphyrin O-methyltransferase
VEAARRGADVVAIDLSPTLVALARACRMPDCATAGASNSIRGDMLDPRWAASTMWWAWTR